MNSVQVARQPASSPISKTHVAASSLVCITVTYHPDLQLLERQLEALPMDAAIVLIDNASAGKVPAELRSLVAARDRVHLIINEHNVGLAAAVNQGASTAQHTWPEIRFLLLLDQDSEPQPGSVKALMDGFASLKDASPPVGCVGPNLLDPITGLSHGFHQHTRWRWKRAFPEQGSTRPVPCANLNGSGTLVPIALFLELGGLEETLFIDHVDTEWAFRVQAAGYSLYGIPQARFIHRMGDDSRRIWLFGWRVWPMRSPERHYYLYRNAAVLLRREYVPRVWKAWAVLKLAVSAVVFGILGPHRFRQIRQMLGGLAAARQFEHRSSSR